MKQRPRTDPPLVRGVQDSASSPESAAADCAFGRALDELLRAWTDGVDLAREQVLQRHPALASDLDALFELAREIAVVRPQRLPTVPGYDVLDEVGRGGMGVVYRARQHGLQRIVALKLLPDAAGDARGRARFLAEARGLGRVRHAHVVTIHEVIETADQVAYAMEWIDGRSLASLLEELAGWPRRGAVPPVRFGPSDTALPDPAVPWFCRLGIAIARALGEVHRHGLVHRDVKPGNVLLRACGTALLSDFGLVRAEQLGLTRTGQVVGTPAFAAPEQLRGSDDVGAAADVWGLGATLHCALAGKVPFAGRTPLELLASIEARRRRPLTVQGLPKDLETIVARCLEAEPRDRYASADAVADDLENLLALRPVQARPLGVLARGWRMLRRNRRMVVAGVGSGMLVLAACALLALWVWNAITLPARFDAALLQARFALLEPTHEERVELAKDGKPPNRPSAFESSGDAALLAYDAALRIDPTRGDIALERDVVAIAQSLLRKQAPQLSANLQQAAPATSAAARAWHAGESTDEAVWRDAAAADRRLCGLLAFLTGRSTECHAAWSPLELTGDPFLDAAAGQMHLQRGEIGKAYARLSRATQVWPTAGFLAVAMADCAVREGDLEAAERELLRAEELGRKDPFDTHVRVRADLRAAQGRSDEALLDYQWMLANHQGASARLHLLDLLEQRADGVRALDLALDLQESGKLPADSHRLTDVAVAWWRGASLTQRTDELMAAWKSPTSRLARLVVHLAKAIPETATPEPRHSSLGVDQVPYAGLATQLEFAKMFRHLLSDNSRLPLATARGLTAIAFAAEFPTLCKRAPISWPSLCAVALPIMMAATSLVAISRDARAQTQWTNTTPSAGLPPARGYPGFVYDTSRTRALLFGGNAATLLGDTWEFQGGAWSQQVPANAPTPRYGHAMVFDDLRGVVLLFGGYQGANIYSNQTWTWNGLNWALMAPAASPSNRYFPGLSIDPSGDVLLFGGSTGTGSLNDTWRWNGTTWTQAIPSGQPGSPSPRRAPAMTLDTDRGVVVLFGGLDGLTALAGTYEWNGTTWNARTPASAPSARGHGVMVYDPARSVSVLHGGHTGGPVLPDTYEWDGTNWTLRAPISPPTLVGHGALWDPSAQQLVVFGGYNSAAATQNQTLAYGATHPPSTAATGLGCTSPTTSLTPALSRAPGTGAWINHALSLQLDNLSSSPQHFHLLLVDLVDPNVPFGSFGPAGCIAHVDTNFLFYILSPTAGSATQALPTIPNNLALAGLSFYAQAATVNLAPVQPLIDAVSNGLQFTIGTR